MTSMTDLQDTRATLVAEARKIYGGAESEDRALTTEESAEFDRLMAKADVLGERIEQGARLANLERNLEASRGRAVKPVTAIGMSPRDVGAYSLLRAIRAAANHDWRGAELEREASDEIARRLGRDPQGFFVPWEWQAASRRDLQAGQPSAGGYLIAPEAGSFIELLRNAMVVQRAGARVLTGLEGPVDFPKQTGGATAYWVGEGGAPTESTQATGQVTLQPRTVGAFTDITRRLLKQSSIDAEAFVREDLAQVVALAVDYAALHGTGAANQPLGIHYTSGIGSVVGGANGAVPTWAHIVSLETEVATDNADVGTLAYMSNAAQRGQLKQTPRTATYGDIMIWEPTAGDTPVNGYRFWVTNQVLGNMSKGSGTNLSAIFFGNWADLLVGFWGGLDILVDPYTASTTGGVRVVALQDCDVAVRHAESFAAMLDADTS